MSIYKGYIDLHPQQHFELSLERRVISLTLHLEILTLALAIIVLALLTLANLILTITVKQRKLTSSGSANAS